MKLIDCRSRWLGVATLGTTLPASALASAANKAAIDDISVTAQRRQERNQNMPIAITAFSGASLARQNITPGQELDLKSTFVCQRRR